MEQAEILRQLLKEIEELLNRNITENGECQFSFIKERVALEDNIFFSLFSVKRRNELSKVFTLS